MITKFVNSIKLGRIYRRQKWLVALITIAYYSPYVITWMVFLRILAARYLIKKIINSTNRVVRMERIKRKIQRSKKERIKGLTRDELLMMINLEQNKYINDIKHYSRSLKKITTRDVGGW